MYDFASIWGEDYYSDDDDDGQSENIPTVEERINFAKYGRKVINATENEASDDTKDHIDDLPDNIYCDLINTLNEKCIQVRQSFVTNNTGCTAQRKLDLNCSIWTLIFLL